ncbi:MAG: response regulator [Liquorilactobacillus ghanensis]|uniref:Two-component system chemotaxis family response regulator CheY n=1 Tax=Liquorilactobacillus ghanensis TaxID=399370 RepID=A0A0A7RFH0_9LACO|nr:response regulator [Liquorilactobacillus ghanensis]AJA33982.1 two-component system chemotaxis family response regulator CheY [Liquorilactobacillus ghanensis]
MGKKILIVDDAVFMRIKLKDILEKNGYEVAGEAQNGQEAFDKYQETKPDLVTMDITMPEVDGLESLKMIRKADANAKVIMCSAMGQQGMVMDAIRAGAIDFIVKPFDTERVIKALDKAFS